MSKDNKPSIKHQQDDDNSTALYYHKNPTQKLLDNSYEGDGNLNITPGFTKDGCVIDAEHSCADEQGENVEEQKEDMVRLFNTNEKKLEDYEGYRNQFVYKALVLMEDFE